MQKALSIGYVIFSLQFHKCIFMEHNSPAAIDDYWKPPPKDDSIAYRHREVQCQNVDRRGTNMSIYFRCPEAMMPPHYTECCGLQTRQFCCSPWETPGVKWGLAVGVTIVVLVLLAMGYTIQVFRACDRCYHDCPICSKLSEEEEFSMDTRWYCVSHEGNRYGVTFHSKRFATHFMELLKKRYGPWNTANMLKILRDDQVFVILNIYFHDLFTPWFYTQGPIKNDALWIRSDFKDLITQCVGDLSVTSSCNCWCIKPQATNTTNHNPGIELIVVDTENNSSPAVVPSENSLLSFNSCSASTTHDNKNKFKITEAPVKLAPNGMRLDHRPWTKHTFRVKPNSEAPSRSSSRNSFRRSRSPDSCSVSDNVKVYNQTVVFIDDIIEVFGNTKAIQTRRKVYI